MNAKPIFKDAVNDTYSEQEIRQHLVDSIEELTMLLKEARGFQQRMEAGELDDGDEFLSFVSVRENGYDNTGPVTIYVELEEAE